MRQRPNCGVGTPIPGRPLSLSPTTGYGSLALTSDFADVEGKRQQWRAFLERNRIGTDVESLDEVVKNIAAFLGPTLEAARKRDAFAQAGSPGGPWQPASSE